MAPTSTAADESSVDDEEESSAVELSREAQAGWTGSFRSDELDAVYRIALVDGALVLTVGNDADGPLTPRSADVLVRGPLRLEATERDGDRIVAFRIAAGRVTNLRFERVEPP